MFVLNQGEQVIGEVRKHWWKLLVSGLGLFITALLPLIVAAVVVGFAQEVTDRTIYIGAFFYTIWITILWIIFFVDWTDYYLDVWVITNHRIVDIEQIGLFSRNVATVRLEDIEDIKSESSGIIGTMLRFGRLTIQTAGAHNEFVLRNAKNPDKAKETIYRLVGDARARNPHH